MKKISILSIVSILVLAGCASITGQSRQSIKIDSNPQGARVEVGGQTITTPAVVDLKGKSEYVAVATKPGYDSTTKVVGSEVRILPAVVGNIFNFTGIIGMAIDFFGTGAAYELDKSVNIDLQKK